MTTQAVEFRSGGEVVRGDLYLPEGDGPFPVVVMAGGWCYVKELRQPQYAEEFVAARVRRADLRLPHMGASDGQPRQHLDPWEQIEDYRNAISYLETRSDIDAGRIGAWGISYSGGHVLILGAIDPRVKAVVSNVPVIDGYENMWRVHGTDRFRKLQAASGRPPQAARVRRLRHIADVGTPDGPDAELVAWPLNEVKVGLRGTQAHPGPQSRALQHHRLGRAAHAVQRRAPTRPGWCNKPVMMIVADQRRHHLLGSRDRGVRLHPLPAQGTRRPARHQPHDALQQPHGPRPRRQGRRQLVLRTPEALPTVASEAAKYT